MRAVGIVYRDLDQPMPELNPSRKLYYYWWPFEEAPQVGDRITVETGEGAQYGIVVEVPDPVPTFPYPLRTVIARQE